MRRARGVNPVLAGVAAVFIVLARPAAAQMMNIPGTAFDVDLQGNMYVIDAGKNTLRLYDKTGALLRDVGGPGCSTASSTGRPPSGPGTASTSTSPISATTGSSGSTVR